MSMGSCYAYLNARIKPIARGNFFETPLAETMKARGGGIVAGGGTLQAKNGEIIHCGIDLDLHLNDETIAFVCAFLTRRGAPRGSKLQFERSGKPVEIHFGEIEGVAVYLNGTDLGIKVYETSDINVVIESFAASTNGRCMYRSYWQGPRETALYMYGPSAAELTSLIAPFMADYPLCQQARVVQIA